MSSNPTSTFVTVSVGTLRFKVYGHKTRSDKWRVELVQPLKGLPPDGRAYLNRRIRMEVEAEVGMEVAPLDLFPAGLVE